MKPTTLLGYDWAAAVADDSRQVGSRAYLDHKEEDLSALSSFRCLHSSSCVGPSRISDLDSEIRDLNPKIDIGFARGYEEGEDELEKRKKDVESHICVFPYEIGERLFSHPLMLEKDSSSVACPICGKGRSPPPPKSKLHFPSSSSSASVVKITLDRRRLLPDYSAPYIPVPKTRRSFDSSDSLSLAAHLLKGSQPLRNADIPPTTRSLGLRRNLKEVGKSGHSDGGKCSGVVSSIKLTESHGCRKTRMLVDQKESDREGSLGLRRNLRQKGRSHV